MSQTIKKMSDLPVEEDEDVVKPTPPLPRKSPRAIGTIGKMLGKLGKGKKQMHDDEVLPSFEEASPDELSSFRALLAGGASDDSPSKRSSAIFGDDAVVTRDRSGSWRGSVLAAAIELSTEENTSSSESNADEDASDSIYIWGEDVPTFVNPNVKIPSALKMKGISHSVQQIALGNGHIVLLTESKYVWTWGGGEKGQLGHRERRNYAVPHLLDHVDGVTFVAGAGDQSALLNNQGACLTWGWCGIKGVAPIYTPKPIASVGKFRAESLALGTKHGILATSLGNVYTWGYNSEGQLGLGSDFDVGRSDAPTEVTLPERCFFVSANEWACSAVSAKGTVYFWGKSWKSEDKIYTSPTKLNFSCMGRDKVVKTALGTRHILALTVMGHVMALGNGENGQLGNGVPPQSSFSDPVSISLARGVQSAAKSSPVDAVQVQEERKRKGSRVSRIRSGSLGAVGGSPSSSHISSRGRRSGSISARLARSSSENKAPPLTPETRVKDITAGGDRSCALTEDGKVWQWGTKQVIVVPRVVKALQDISMAAVACTSSCIAVLVGLSQREDFKFHSFNPPTIRAGTLERLIEWIYNEKTKPSPMFAYTLVLCHKSFSTTEEMLQMVRDGYENGNEFIQNKLTQFVVRWLQDRGEDFCVPKMREQLEDFLGVLNGKLANVAKKIATRLWLQDPVAEDLEQLTPVATEDVPQMLHERSPTEVAEQITLQDHRAYCKINAREFIGQGWSKPDKLKLAPGVVAVTHRFNMLSYRIIAHIISSQSLSERTQRYQWWVEIHRQLFNLNNFNGCMCVSSALSSVPLRRLTKRNLFEVKPSATKWLDFWGDLVKLNNKAGYRTALKRVTNHSEPCIPYIGFHMSDLTFIEDGNKPKIGDLVNFRRFKMIAQQIRTLEQFASRKYMGLQSDPELAAVFSVMEPPGMDALDAITESIINSAVLSPVTKRHATVLSPVLKRRTDSIKAKNRLTLTRASSEGALERPSKSVPPRGHDSVDKNRIDAWKEMLPRANSTFFRQEELSLVIEDVLKRPLISIDEESVFTELCSRQTDLIQAVSAVSQTEPGRDLIKLFLRFVSTSSKSIEIRVGLRSALQPIQEAYSRAIHEQKSAMSLRTSQQSTFAVERREQQSERDSLLDQEQELERKLAQVRAAREAMDKRIEEAELRHENADKNMQKKVTIMQVTVNEAGESLSAQETAIRFFDRLMLSRAVDKLQKFRDGQIVDTAEHSVRQQFIAFSRDSILPMIQALSKEEQSKSDANTILVLLKEAKLRLFNKDAGEEH